MRYLLWTGGMGIGAFTAGLALLHGDLYAAGIFAVGMVSFGISVAAYTVALGKK